MLSQTLNFISKRKTKIAKAKPVIRRVDSDDFIGVNPFSSSTLEIIDIIEKPSPQINSLPLDVEPQEDVVEEEEMRPPTPPSRPTLQNKSSSPRVDLVINEENLNDWFPRHLLKSGDWSGEGLAGGEGPSRGGGDRAMPQESDSQYVEQGFSTKDRRPPPTPIKIPNNSFHAPKIQIQRQSSSFLQAPSRPDSMASFDNMSSVSGTTLARALLGGSFIFPMESSRRSSRYRSGTTALTRQDSATLPRGDHPLLNSPYWRDRSINGDVRTPDSRDEYIPPVPPVPTETELQLIQMKAEERNAVSKGRQLHDTLDVSHHRISRISEGSSIPASPGNTTAPGSSAENGESTQEIEASSSLGLSLSPKDGNTSPDSNNSLVRSVPTSASLYTPEQLSASQTPSSGRDLDNVLDYYQFVAAVDFHLLDGVRHTVSPIIEETSSAGSSVPSPYVQVNGQIAPRNHSDWSRNRSGHAQQTPRTRSTLLPIGENSPRRTGFQQEPTASWKASLRNASDTALKPSGDSASTLASLGSDSSSTLPPPPTGIFNRARSGSAPSPITVVRDPRDLRTYNISVSPLDEPNSASENEAQSVEEPVNSSQQTFPETPRAFTPLWSAGVDSVNGSFSSLAEAGITLGSYAPRRTGSQSSSRSVARGNQVAVGGRLTPPPEESPSARTTPNRSPSHPTPRNVEFSSLSSEQTSVGRRDWVAALAADSRSTSEMVSPRTHVKSQSASSTFKSPNHDTSTQVPHLATPPPSHTPSSISPASANSSSLHARVFSRSDPFLPGTENPRRPSAPEFSTSSTDIAPNPILQRSTSHQVQSNAQAHLPAPLPAIPQSNDQHLAAAAPSFFRSSSTPPSVFTQNNDRESISGPFIAPPPPYDAVYDAPQMITETLITQTQTRTDNPPAFRSVEETANRRLTRSRPPLPAGPRRPSGQYSTLQRRGTGDATGRTRTGSVSSVNTNYVPHRVYSSSSPKFRVPVPKWRGYTMDAAKWTFSSAELQGIVSQAIRQSSQASTIRLLQPEVFNVQLPQELMRLEGERNELTTRYKVLTRKRCALLSSLTAYMEGCNEIVENPATGLRIADELQTVSSTLDQVAEELLGNAESITQLDSLRDTHSYSALAMALRKLNGSFVKQVAENQVLREQVSALEAEKEEAWKQAESVAHDFDDLTEHVPDQNLPDYVKASRATRVSRRKSRIVTETSLRSSSIHRSRSQRSSYASNRASVSTMPSGSRSAFGSDLLIPPVPPIPSTRRPLGIITDGGYGRESSFTTSDNGSTFENSALVRAQQDLYAMLGLTVEERRGRPRPRSLSGSATGHSTRPPSPRAEPESQYATTKRRRRPSSLPGSAGLRNLYDTVSADRQAMLTTLDLMAAD